MTPLKRVKKVIAYITCENKLLVFPHRDFPANGLEVPGGTVENPHDLPGEVLREAQEETGLDNLKIVRYLGTLDYDISYLRPEMHERHFFHLEAAPPAREKWLHYEMYPSGGDGKPVAFECFWIDKKDVTLAHGFNAMLDKIP